MQAPNTAVVLWSVPARLRPFAMSLQVIVIHVFGDVPSPVLLGWLQERLQNWRCAWLPRCYLGVIYRGSSLGRT